MSDYPSWCKDYESTRRSFLSFRSKGLMSDVELLEFKAKLEVLEKLFQQIQRSNDSLMKEVKASELSRREVLLKNFSQEVTIILRDRHVGKNQQADYVESNDQGAGIEGFVDMFCDGHFDAIVRHHFGIMFASFWESF